MHDIKEIKNNIENFKKSLKKRFLNLNVNEILKLDEDNRSFIQKKESLEKEKIIRGYYPELNPEKVGFNLTAIINLRISKGKIMDLQDSIAKHPQVFGVYDVTGEWDSLILARFKNRQEMDSFIKTTLSQKHIERSNTSLVLNTVKEEPRVIL